MAAYPHYDKAPSFVRKVRGMAAVFEVFYNSVIATQLTDAAVVFEALAVERVNGRPKHPLVVLAVAFETLMNRFIISIRSQLTKLILGMERTRKSTKRPALFSNLRLAMEWARRASRAVLRLAVLLRGLGGSGGTVA